MRCTPINDHFCAAFSLIKSGTVITAPRIIGGVKKIQFCKIGFSFGQTTYGKDFIFHHEH
jgi:hypothetical protein